MLRSVLCCTFSTFFLFCSTRSIQQTPLVRCMHSAEEQSMKAKGVQHLVLVVKLTLSCARHELASCRHDVGRWAP